MHYSEYVDLVCQGPVDQTIWTLDYFTDILGVVLRYHPSREREIGETLGAGDQSVNHLVCILVGVLGNKFIDCQQML